MTAPLYEGPTGNLINADREAELVRLALNDAWGFEYHAPGTRDWWTVFWRSLERHRDSRRAAGQVPLEAWS